LVKVTDDGVFPVARDKVWKLIEAHGTDAMTIHPSIKSFKHLRKEGDSDVVEYQWEMGGQKVKIVAKFTANPPNQLTIDFLDGPMTGKMVNTYSEVQGGTKVVSACDMNSQFMDGKQLETTIRQFLENNFNEDLRYLATKLK